MGILGQTVREVAAQLGITKPAVQHRMNQIDGFRDEYVRRIGNRLVINEPGVKALLNIDNKTSQSQSNDKRSDQFFCNDRLLLEQLKVKDAQLEITQRQIENMQKLLDQQQHLQIELTKVNKDLRQQIKTFEEYIHSDTCKLTERDNSSVVTHTQEDHVNLGGQTDSRNSQTNGDVKQNDSSSKLSESMGFFHRFIKN